MYSKLHIMIIFFRNKMAWAYTTTTFILKYTENPRYCNKRRKISIYRLRKKRKQNLSTPCNNIEFFSSPLVVK